MRTEQIQESGRLVDLSQLPKQKKRGRPKGSKSKIKPDCQNGSATVKTAKATAASALSRNETANRWEAVYSMHLANVRPLEIAKKTKVHIDTVRRLIKEGDKLLCEGNNGFLIGIVRGCFVKAIDGHKMMSDEHTIAFRTIQMARDKLKPGSKDRLAHEARLRLIGRELTATNKAFVELLCRMGVPHAPGSPNDGSHTDGSTDDVFSDSVYSKLSVEDAEVLAIETAEKQLKYLKSERKKRVVEEE